MKIRLARDEDYVAMARLRRQTIRHINAKDYPADVIQRWSGSTNAQGLRDSADYCKRWVALDCNKIIGFCEHSLTNELSRIYVHKDYLRQAVGSRLLKTAEKSLVKLGCQKVTLQSTITARNFYVSNGYKIIKKSFYKGNRAEPIYQCLKTLAKIN